MKISIFLITILISLNSFAQTIDVKGLGNLLGSASSQQNLSVHILGHVNKPGTYNLEQGSRLNEALNMANGIAWDGLITGIEIRDETGTIGIFNLFKFRSAGDLNHNPFVKENDIIFVPSVGDGALITKEEVK